MMETIAKFTSSVATVMVVAFALTPELATALAILIGAIFVGIVNVMTARTARLVAMRETQKAVAPMAKKIDDLGPVVQKIEGTVNSDKARADTMIDAQRKELALQRETIAELRKTAALAAQAKVATDVAAAAAATPPTTSSDE